VTRTVAFRLNGRPLTREVDDAELLCDCLRERLGQTGTRVGCREGVCGSCDVLVDGVVARSCMLLAAQVDGCEVTTVEGLAARSGAPDGALSPLQRAFVDHGAVQCGFCTAGFLVCATALLERDPDPSPERIVAALSGNLCRCTGYAKVVAAVQAVARDGAGAREVG
jgi:aerobic-type carbon monoxide dehydrogenase small subunit (CoxS/CutS family)